MEERLEAQEGRYDEQAQIAILERARQLQAAPPKASMADLERIGEELGIPKTHLWQAIAEYEASVGTTHKKPKKVSGEIEWGTFAVMAIHFVVQLFMLFRWMGGMGAFQPFEFTRWYIFLPFAILLGLLSMGSIGKLKRTVAYLIGSMSAGYLISFVIHEVQGYFPVHFPKAMLAVLAMEIAVVAVLGLKGFLTDPKRALKQLFGSPMA